MKKIIQFSLIIALCALAFAHYGVAFFASFAALAFMIFFHELGHFAAARACGVAVRRFSIGFGGVIFARRFGNTIYQLAAVPLGGYVKMKGENSAKCSQHASSRVNDGSYENAPLVKKLFILLAGPGANFLLGWLIFFALACMQQTDLAPKVYESQNAALVQNDEILAINGVRVQGFSDISPLLKKDNQITIRRDERVLDISATASLNARTDALGRVENVYVLGIRAVDEKVHFYRDFAQAFASASAQTAQTASLIGATLKMLLSGQIAAKELGGIIAINDVASSAFSANLHQFALIIALISINLGVMNLLPIPVLDGGHVVILLLGAIFGARAQSALLKYGGYVGIAALGALMCFATFNDINRLIN